MTMLTCGRVLIIISFIVALINGRKCGDILHGKSYWIWSTLPMNAGTKKYNKYFVAASYDKNEGKFTYTKNEHTISFKINKKNCDKFAYAISNPDADGIVRLQTLFVTHQYKHKTNAALNVNRNIKSDILIRPIQADKDKDILWVGKDYDDIHYKIYNAIEGIIYGDKWHLDEYSHQFVFTKITRLVPQNDDYHNDIETIKNHGGIVLFGDGEHKYGHSDEIAKSPEMESVHIMNLHKHYIDGKTKPFCIQDEKKKLTEMLLNNFCRKCTFFQNKEKIVDVYSYLGDYDAKIPEMQRTWTRETNIKVPNEEDAKAKDLIKYKDEKNNELYMFHTEHEDQDIANNINNKLKTFNEIEYVLIEYDRQRIKDKITTTGYGKIDMMATAYAAFADNMKTKKLILADFPNYSPSYFEGTFLLYNYMVNKTIYAHVWFALRNAVMVNTINAVVHKHEQESTEPTKLWITIGAQHGNPTNPAEKPIFLKKYSMEPMLLRPENKFTISYVRDDTGKRIKWNMDAEYFREAPAYFGSKYVGLENKYNYYDDGEYDYDYHTKAGDIIGYNYYIDHIGYGTHGGLMLLLSIGMAIIAIIVIMYIYMLLCCICGAVTGSCIYEQTQRNDTKNGKNHIIYHDNSDRDHSEV